MTRMTRKVCLIILTLFPLLCGCKPGDITLKIRYDRIEGLKQNDRVLFEQNQIGTVTRVIYTAEGRYEADVSIRKEFASAATENSEFFIVSDPQQKDKKAVEIIQSRKGGTALNDGAVVEGSTQVSDVFNVFRDKLNKGINDLGKQFGQFLNELKGLSESEAMKKLEEELNRLGEEMQKSGKTVQDKIQKEVLPQLQKEIDRLREELRKFGRENEVSPLEDKMNKIKEL